MYFLITIVVKNENTEKLRENKWWREKNYNCKQRTERRISRGNIFSYIVLIVVYFLV